MEQFPKSASVGVVIVIFHIFHLIVKYSDWPESNRAFVDSLHTYALYAALGLFSIDFTLKLLKLSFVITAISFFLGKLKMATQVIYNYVKRKNQTSEKEANPKAEDN